MRRPRPGSLDLLIALVVFSAASVGCGALDSKMDPPVTTLYEQCLQAADIGCDKTFSCYSADELAPLMSLLGATAADCKIRSHAACAPSDMCPQGTFQPGKATSCIEKYRAYTCDQFKQDAYATMACKDACS